MRLSKKKGQASDTAFILGLMIFIAFLIFLTTQIQAMYPTFQTIGAFDMAFFAGELLLVAGACVVATGLACAGALAFFAFTSFFFIQNTLLNILLFIPITVAVAMVIARLARGNQ